MGGTKSRYWNGSCCRVREMENKMEQYLRVGVITSPHGVRGEVKVFPTTDDPERFLDLEEVLLDAPGGLKKLEIEQLHFFKNKIGRASCRERV